MLIRRLRGRRPARVGADRWTRTRSRDDQARTAPRSARAARPRCSTPTGPARHGPAPVHDHADRARDWDRIWKRRARGPAEDPRAAAAGRGPHAPALPGRRSSAPPWQPKRNSPAEGNDLGVPARVFPQWLRCTGCDLLAPVSTGAVHLRESPTRIGPTGADFVHEKCKGWAQPGQAAKAGPGRRSNSAVPARYLIACVNGHLDEFPYDAVGAPRSRAVPASRFRHCGCGSGRATSVPMCRSICCPATARRGMLEAPGRRRPTSYRGVGDAIRTWTRSTSAASLAG